MTEKEIRHLKALIERYLNELDDEDFDESYNTDRGFAQNELNAFLAWLDE